jgi:Predicted integral membrane protein (DUF2269)
VQWLFPWLLFLHVFAAVVAFGQPFGYGVIGAMAAREPQHANFATRITHTLSDRVVIPLALTMPVTGAGMILVNGINLTLPQYRWLGAAIVVYVVVVVYAIVVQRRAVERLIALTAAPPPPGASGPPPEVPAAVRRVQRGGMLLAGGIVLILFLMVVKPGFGG